MCIQIQTKFNNCKKEKEEKSQKVSNNDIEEYVKEVLKFKDINKIDRNILVKLIDKIVIENRKISNITYNFSI